MTTYIVGPTGAGIEDGSDWDNRLAGLNAGEDVPVVPGDIVKAGPGVYREQLTSDVSGGNTYSTGTAGVTNGSDQVIGNGTAWVANVAADYYFHVRYYDNGADGVANGTATFTAAGGNFHANLIGVPIQINARGAYVVGAVAAANSLTLLDPNGLGWPGAGGGLTYSIMSGEGHHEIESVDDNTTITLKQPWQGKTHTGLSYLTFNAITYIADVTGENTDDVGGVVRITGSDNDTSATRSTCISCDDDYRVFRGFSVDVVTSDCILLDGSLHIILEDIIGTSANKIIKIQDTSQSITMRRCKFLAALQPVLITHGVTVDDSGHVIENCLYLAAGAQAARIDRVGGVQIRNAMVLGGNEGIRIVQALATGQTIAINNSVFNSINTALRATALGEITEDYNAFHRNGADRNTVATGANSNTFPPLLNTPILFAGTDQLSGYKFPWLFGELSEWSQIAAIAGVDERNTDLFGIRRPNHTAAKNSWGPVQFHDNERETTTTRGASAASIIFHDAGVHHIWVPVENTEITISVWVYREANYAGTLPRMTIKQPGQADDVTTDAAAAAQWNELTTTLTPAADPPYVVVEMQSLNTAAAGNFDIFWDDLTVT